MRSAVTEQVAIVLKGYPRLSETFIAQEILGLQQRGLRLSLISLRHPTDKKRHPLHDRITAPVSYLPEYLHQEPGRVLRGWQIARRLPGYRRARALWRRDLLRDPSRNRVRRFGQALVLAAELPAGTTRLYAHFLHTPASVARYAAIMRAIPWCCSAHAKDIWTIPDWEKREKLADCDWLVSCTAANVDHLQRLAADPNRVSLLYHGLDAGRFPAAPAARPARDGSQSDDPVRILSVGRLVGKKGYDDLLAALAALPAGLAWRFEHIGGGPLKNRLRARAEALGIAGRCLWRGPEDQQAVIEAACRADLFALACRIEADGDRDGLPNVLMEAQILGLPVVSTRVSAIPELIHDGHNGLLVAERDPTALAAALAALIGDPERRARLGRRGAVVVRDQFAFDAGLDRLAARFGLGAPQQRSA